MVKTSLYNILCVFRIRQLNFYFFQYLSIDNCFVIKMSTIKQPNNHKMKNKVEIKQKKTNHLKTVQLLFIYYLESILL